MSHVYDQRRTGAFYEQERLLLHIQELMAQAKASRPDVVRPESKAALAAEYLTTHKIARFLQAYGYRLTVALEKLP